MHPWLQTLHDALSDEERTARQRHRDWLALPLDRQVEVGVCWADVRVTDVQPDGRKWIAVLRGDLHEGIGAGDRIRLGESGPRGRVSFVDLHGAEVLLEGEPLVERTHVVRLHDDGTFRRYQKALERADANPNDVVRALLEPAESDGEPTHAWTGLNPSQVRAANGALKGPVALIHGPPGTGKTYVIARLLQHAVSTGDRPWALADSNAAANHLAVTARNAGLAVLRIGVPARIHPDLQDCTLDAWIARSPQASPLASVDKELNRARSRRESGRVLGPLYDERRALRRAAREWAWSSAEVLVSTHGTLAGRLGMEPHPPAPELAIVDEATQAVEPAIWACAPFVERLVLVGDPEQLGPVVLTPGNPLATSLLERLLLEREAPMLTVQHRMNAAIHGLVQHVYGPSYTAHPSVADRTIADLPPVQFVDTAGMGDGEAIDPSSQSRFNDVELDLVERALQRLRARGVRTDQIAIAAPYSAQVRRLAALPAAQGVRVGSINALQGQEADVVLLSFVRSNERGEIGFLSDERRLTVGLTRAREHLWMCGDSGTLARHPLFARLLEQCDQEGALTSVWEPPWSD